LRACKIEQNIKKLEIKFEVCFEVHSVCIIPPDISAISKIFWYQKKPITFVKQDVGLIILSTYLRIRFQNQENLVDSLVGQDLKSQRLLFLKQLDK